MPSMEGSFAVSLILLVRLMGKVESVATCVEPKDIVYTPDTTIRGNLLLTCSGADYILSYDSDFAIYSLSLFAECSIPCKEEKKYYYFDTTNLTRRDINSLDGIVNGSHELNMPSTLESNCTVFGQYFSLRNPYNFPNASCLREFPSPKYVSTTQAAVFNNSRTNSGTTEMQETLKTLSQTSTESSTAFGSRTTLSLAESFMNSTALMRVGIPTAVVLSMLIIISAILLLFGLCHHFHRNKSNTIKLQYNEKIFDNVVSNCEFKVYSEGDELFNLAPAMSQISVFDSFSKFTVDLEKPPILKADLEMSYCVGSHCETGKNDCKHLSEIDSIEKVDLSDTSSAGGESELTEEITQEKEGLSETASEPSPPNSPSPRTPCCSTPIRLGSTSDHHRATHQNEGLPFTSSYIHSSSHGTGVLEVDFPMEMQHVPESGYVSNIGRNMHTTHELLSTLSALSINTELTSAKQQYPAGSSYLQNDKGYMTESLSLTGRPTDIAMPNAFSDRNFSSNDALASSSQPVSLVGTELLRESYSTTSLYLSNSGQPRTVFNPHSTSVDGLADIEDISVSTGSLQENLRSYYLQNGIQPSQNLLGNVDAIKLEGASPSSSHRSLQTVRPNKFELNVGQTPALPLHVIGQNRCGYVTNCSEISACTSSKTAGMLMLESAKYLPEYSTDVNHEANVLHSENLTRNNRVYSCSKMSTLVKYDHPEEEDRTDVLFVGELSLLDEDTDDHEERALNHGCDVTSGNKNQENKAVQDLPRNNPQTAHNVSISLEFTDHVSEAAEDLGVCNGEYLNSNKEEDNSDGRSSSMEQWFMIKDEQQQKGGYICSDLIAGTDSVQFYFPYQKAGFSGAKELVPSPAMDRNKDCNGLCHQCEYNAASVDDIFTLNRSSRVSSTSIDNEIDSTLSSDF